MSVANDPAELFRHVSTDKADFYRRIMDVFAAAKRQYRLQLRPDEVLAEVRWPGVPPRIEELNAALAQLADWGNLQSQPDTARVSNLSDFYRAKYLYRLSLGGEAVEAALAVFFQTLQHRAELQTVALEDIASRLVALQHLIDANSSGDGPDSTIDGPAEGKPTQDPFGSFDGYEQAGRAVEPIAQEIGGRGFIEGVQDATGTEPENVVHAGVLYQSADANLSPSGNRR